MEKQLCRSNWMHPRSLPPKRLTLTDTTKIEGTPTHSGTFSPAESDALAMHTGDATLRTTLTRPTFFKLAMGVNSEARAATGLARNGHRSAGKRALIWPGAPARHARQPCEGGSEPTGEPSASAEPATAAMALEALRTRWPRKSSQADAATLLLLLRDSASVAQARSVRHLRLAPFPSLPGPAGLGRAAFGLGCPARDRNGQRRESENAAEGEASSFRQEATWMGLSMWRGVFRCDPWLFRVCSQGF